VGNEHGTIRTPRPLSLTWRLGVDIRSHLSALVPAGVAPTTIGVTTRRTVRSSTLGLGCPSRTVEKACYWVHAARPWPRHRPGRPAAVCGARSATRGALAEHVPSVPLAAKHRFGFAFLTTRRPRRPGPDSAEPLLRAPGPARTTPSSPPYLLPPKRTRPLRGGYVRARSVGFR